MGTDIVIPLGTGSCWEDNELRYSLRSFEKYLSDIGRVFIVSETIPSWIQGVIQVNCPDVGNVPSTNTTVKILRACREGLSDHFLLSNDDFFLLKPFRADHFPYFFRQDLLFNIHKLDKAHHYECRKNTYLTLAKAGFQTRNFEVHCPMLFNTERFLKIMNRFPMDGLLPRSIYGNVLKLHAEQKGDYIINLPLNLPGPLDRASFFSVRFGPVNPEMKLFFELLYPQKSRWEL